MAIKHFKDLDVYQKSYAVSLLIHKASLEFPKIEQYAIANQLRRSSKSVCANLAEGFTKQYVSNKEYMRFILIALASANETIVWLDYVEDLGYVEQDLILEWKEEYSQICKMLNALHNSRKKLNAA